MVHRPFVLPTVYVIAAMLAAGSLSAWGRDGYVIKFPRHSELTAVQRLNRQGVEAVKKHDYRAAEALFYKAFLYDPADPFTLNNLGYVSELGGNLDRAQKFYRLASEQGSNANIDISSAESLEGKPMRAALVDLQDVNMRVNQTNIQAMRLLSENRALEALALLKWNLSFETQNPFTLNNLGVASEATGDYDSAELYYRAAAALQSREPATITLNHLGQGRSVSELAAASADRLGQRIQNAGPNEERASILMVQGIMAANQNQWTTAREDFLTAYSLDPTSGFAMNDRGWVAEKDGDLESAQYFYRKAQLAGNAGVPVGFATRSSAEGQSLRAVANESNGKVDDVLDIYSRQRKRESATVGLIRRGGSSSSNSENSPSTDLPFQQP